MDWKRIDSRPKDGEFFVCGYSLGDISDPIETFVQTARASTGYGMSTDVHRGTITHWAPSPQIPSGVLTLAEVERTRWMAEDEARELAEFARLKAKYERT